VVTDLILPFRERFRTNDALAFPDGDDLVGPHIREVIHLATGPTNLDRVGLLV
jgi:hypothetical protein